MAQDLGFKFTWYGHACVELETPGGKRVLIDPWFGNPLSRPVWYTREVLANWVQPARREPPTATPENVTPIDAPEAT